MNIHQLKLHLSKIKILNAYNAFGYLQLEFLFDTAYKSLTYDGHMHGVACNYKLSRVNRYAELNRANQDYEQFCVDKEKIEPILFPVLPTIYLNPAAFKRVES